MHELIEQLLELPTNLVKMMYLEGIVQSLYFKYNDIILKRNGNAVIRDASTLFFDNPNIIGVRRKAGFQIDE